MINGFKCIAEKCRHNCCIGWEIDIDEETYKRYTEVKGQFGDRLREGITSAEDGSHCFKLAQNDRCVFLNDDNLCDIILNLGEDYLCDICAEHPRFYVQDEDGDYYTGYGLCCEEAARILLFGDYEPSEEAYRICDELVDFPDFRSDKAWIDFAEYLLSLEQLGTAWGEWQNKLISVAKSCDITDAYKEALVKVKDDRDKVRKAFAAVMDYLLFRHESYRYAEIIWQYLNMLIILENDEQSDFAGHMIEMCRVYSSEIEYSDINVDLIFNKIESMEE